MELLRDGVEQHFVGLQPVGPDHKGPAVRRGLGTGYKLIALLDLSMNASPRRLMLEHLSHELGLPQATVDRMATWHEIQDADGVRIPGARLQPSFLRNPCTFPIYDKLDLRYRHLCPRCTCGRSVARRHRTRGLGIPGLATQFPDTPTCQEL